MNCNYNYVKTDESFNFNFNFIKNSSVLTVLQTVYKNVIFVCYNIINLLFIQLSTFVIKCILIFLQTSAKICRILKPLTFYHLSTHLSQRGLFNIRFSKKLFLNNNIFSWGIFCKRLSCHVRKKGQLPCDIHVWIL